MDAELARDLRQRFERVVYSRSCSKSRAFSIATATCAPNCRSIISSISVNCPAYR